MNNQYPPQQQWASNRAQPAGMPPQQGMPQQQPRGPPQQGMPQQQPRGMPQQQPRGPPQPGMPQQQPRGMPQQQPRGMPQQQPRGQPGMPQQQPRGMPQQQPRGMPQQQPRGMPQQQPRGMPQQQARGMPQQQPRGPPQPGMPHQQPPRGMPHQQPPRGPPPPGSMNMQAMQQNLPQAGQPPQQSYPPRGGAQQGYPPRGAPQQQYPPNGGPQQGAMPGQQYVQQPAHAPPASKPRIDPKQIPRPQFTEQIIQFRSSCNNTSVPNVHQDYVAYDDGNVIPRYMRMTMNSVPQTSDLLKSSNLPLAAIIHPFADLKREEAQPPVVDTAQSGPTRCGRCRGYINPFVQFQGSNWRCNLCGMENPAPPGLAGNYNMYGGSVPPEISKASVDFVVHSDYMVRPAQEHVQVYLVDMSNIAIQSGNAFVVIDTLSRLMDVAAVERPSLKVGIVSFDTSICYYDTSSNKDPQILVVNDVDDAFSPLPPSKWLIPVQQGKDQLQALLAMLKSNAEKKYADLSQSQHQQQASSATPPGSCAGACIRAVVEGLKACGGKAVLFTSSLPTMGQGILKDREFLKLYGTEKESEMFTPNTSDTFYKALARECAEAYISVDVFALSSSFMDMGTMSLLCQSTGGTLFHFEDLHAGNSVQTTRFTSRLKRVVVRNIALEAVLKVRCSQGLRVVEYIGAGVKRVRGGELDVAYFDADQSCTVVLEHDSSIKDNEPVYLQCAILCTSLDKKRIVRVHNQQLATTNSLSDVYRCADLDAIANVFARQAARDILYDESTGSAPAKLKHIRDRITNTCVNVLHSYRLHCASASSSGQLILPESLKLLPLYCLSVIKSDLLRTNGVSNNSSSQGNVDVRADRRVCAALVSLTSSVELYSKLIYPLLFSIPETADGNQPGPHYIPVPPTAESLSLQGVFLLDDGQDLYLFLGQDVQPQLKEQIVRAQENNMYIFTPTTGAFARAIVSTIQRLRPESLLDELIPSILVVMLKGPHEQLFLNKLVEDQLLHETSYISYLVHIHKQIQNKMTYNN